MWTMESISYMGKFLSIEDKWVLTKEYQNEELMWTNPNATYTNKPILLLIFGAQGPKPVALAVLYCVNQ